MPALALVLGDAGRVIGVDAIPHRTWPLEHPAVLPGLQVEPVNLAAFVADDCKVTARGDGDGGNRVTDSVGDTLSIHLRRGLEDVLAEDAVGVKATTNETLGPEGREEGISCHAVALLQKP